MNGKVGSLAHRQRGYRTRAFGYVGLNNEVMAQLQYC